MSRQIVLDTETTGMDPATGDRIVEIGCVEMVDRMLTGNHFHVYINPERDMPVEAFKVHGLSEEFLSDKPVFASIAQDFVDYIDGAELIIHNAAFDMKFLDHELKLLKMQTLSAQCGVIDSLKMARDMYPGQRNSLDALCRRLGIDNSKRTLHGALLDSEILAQVFLAMTGGQDSLFGGEGDDDHATVSLDPSLLNAAAMMPEATRVIYATAEEIAAHDAFFAKLKK
ncbi:DNA polymerase III subunit epsilon [Wohlfahrtiimonas chitiniclastica]|uniref:DNA polymerase III subunit epsilon n=1 Tax=Wohlfahrtiimonas chitiniclastica TaxID=400946 RepID=UPI0007B40453|nr:DNA polymerase III subunit epsilon [Wohlfahrtiimonas chitiniclastica]KZS23983.1 DNA polymerase III subunit epsilon [Wohlfahrtiimonas chitiniclastica]KZX36756.1 DNA polymerase III subunit epsilon [Wohlfahrtiimonas chitiniclastica]MBS7819426.1 DNA polymerase III subunit epsilon [Wohlfahrtiimonas chitiniclastica]MBS7827255.1 DNA polymerase III subunit epsilon [Wohlfahrtiimonas chitiniclastica]WHR54505.1 DNA polymerase III subunit epsilon [Wohlfahrtiimonas chitiniclastica]